MSGTTTRAGTPVSSLPAPTTVANTDTVFMLVVDSTGTAVSAMVPLSVVLASVLSLGGGVMTGMLTLAGPPTLPLQPATKGYVDSFLTSQIQDIGTDLANAQAASAAAATAASNAAAAATTSAEAQITAARDQPNGVAALDSTGALVLQGTTLLEVLNGLVILKPTFPTSDPGVIGAVWNNGDYLCVSQGAGT